MERCILFKNIDQQLTGNNGINGNTCVLDLLQRLISLKHDQCTGLSSSHLKAGMNHFCNSTFQLLLLLLFSRTVGEGDIPQEVLLSQPLQSMAKLGLKNHNDGNGRKADQILGDPYDGSHL